MEKSNIIISVIIVICIAAGVTAYGLTNQDNAFFSELPGLDGSNSGDGKGNATNSSSNSGSSSSGSNSGVGTGSGSSSGSGSNNLQTQPSNPQPNPPTKRIPAISPDEALEIAKAHAEGYSDIRISHDDVNYYYIANVYDENGVLVIVLLINDETGLPSMGG